MEGIEFMVVGCEDAHCAYVVVEVFERGLGNGESVVGCGSPSDFIEDDEGMGICLVQDGGDVEHFDHEGGLSLRDIVVCAEAGEESVQDAHFCFFCGYEGTVLGEYGDEGILS